MLKATQQEIEVIEKYLEDFDDFIVISSDNIPSSIDDYSSIAIYAIEELDKNLSDTQNIKKYFSQQTAVILSDNNLSICSTEHNNNMVHLLMRKSDSEKLEEEKTKQQDNYQKENDKIDSEKLIKHLNDLDADYDKVREKLGRKMVYSQDRIVTNIKMVHCNDHVSDYIKKFHYEYAMMLGMADDKIYERDNILFIKYSSKKEQDDAINLLSDYGLRGEQVTKPNFIDLGLIKAKDVTDEVKVHLKLYLS